MHRLSSLKRGFASIYHYSSPANPRVWLTVASGETEVGKLEFELYSNLSPENAEHFRALCTGERGHSYEGTSFKSVVEGWAATTEDIEGTDYRITDENLDTRHLKRGTLSLNNSGPNKNGSGFLVTFGKTDALDGYHNVIGELTSGGHVLDAIEAAGRRGEESGDLRISGSGAV